MATSLRDLSTILVQQPWRVNTGAASVKIFHYQIVSKVIICFGSINPFAMELKSSVISVGLSIDVDYLMIIERTSS